MERSGSGWIVGYLPGVFWIGLKRTVSNNIQVIRRINRDCKPVTLQLKAASFTGLCFGNAKKLNIQEVSSYRLSNKDHTGKPRSMREGKHCTKT
jgi:hypothetical protein